jgi:hypothetical protein
MCKTFEDSLISGVTGISIATYLLSLGKPAYTWIAYLFFSIASMQFVDAAIWYRRAQGLDTVTLSKYVIPTILAIQPIALYMGFLLIYPRMPLYEILYAIYLVGLLYYWTTLCIDTTVASDGFLKWCGFELNSLSKFSHIFILLIPLLYFPDTVLKFLIIGPICVTWLYNYSRESFGSGWCYTENFGGLAVVARILMK